jgi:hypothetical protein
MELTDLPGNGTIDPDIDGRSDQGNSVQLLAKNEFRVWRQAFGAGNLHSDEIGSA